MQITGKNFKRGIIKFNAFASLEDYKNAFEFFKVEHGRYPTTHDMNNCDYLPTSRTIQRKFGSLKNLRMAIGFTGSDIDNRTGTQRSCVALTANLNSFDHENDISQILVAKYLRTNVHFQSSYADNFGQRCDFKVYMPKDKIMFIDIFWPKDKYSLGGCITHKQKKIEKVGVKDPVYFIVMNKDMDQRFIDNVVFNKKNKLPENVQVLSYENAISVL